MGRKPQNINITFNILKNGMINITKASERRIINQGKFIIRMLPLGLSIPNYNDRGLYQIGRIDHATLQAGVVVPMHLHRDDEILSYMRKGIMHHKDSNGNDIAINNQYLMMMNAGRGFYHEESVKDGDETVEMLQLFFRPGEDRLSPQVQFHKFENPIDENKWRLIGGNESTGAPLKINTEVAVYDILLKSKQIETPIPRTNKEGFLYVFDGEAKIENNGEIIEKGDSVFFEEIPTLSTDSEAVLVYFELDKNASYSRNGLYAQ
jgi:quercetin 2,3-dioxygenase